MARARRGRCDAPSNQDAARQGLEETEECGGGHQARPTGQPLEGRLRPQPDGVPASPRPEFAATEKTSTGSSVENGDQAPREGPLDHPLQQDRLRINPSFLD